MKFKSPRASGHFFGKSNMGSEPPQDPNERFRQAKTLMHDGISSSLAGRPTEAIQHFEEAQDRFTELNETLDAGVAGAWIYGLKNPAP